ncbi:30S ribosome-binding factor RbfA [Candidatus Margulisiibacteriota bacterium]
MSRTDRVAAFIKKEISDILQRKVSDPRIGFVTITDVEIGEDLQVAKVYVSIMGDEKQKRDAMKGLQSASSHIRHELGPRLELKSLPELIFKQDDSIERGGRIFSLLNKLAKERGNEKHI